MKHMATSFMKVISSFMTSDYPVTDWSAINPTLFLCTGLPNSGHGESYPGLIEKSHATHVSNVASDQRYQIVRPS